MMPPPLPAVPYTLVVGLGTTGLSCARFLARQGQPVVVTDSRPTPPGLESLIREWPDLVVRVGGFDLPLFQQASRIVLSPGIAPTEPAVLAATRQGVPVVGDIELFAQQAKAPVIAITGSNGKSTVTTLVGEIAQHAGYRVAVGGNLGTAALDLLPQPGEAEPELYVLELSSFQLETTYSLQAAAGVVLNLSPDHLDRHGTLANYLAAKARVYRGDGVMVVNADDPAVMGLVEGKRRVCRFGLGEPSQETDYGLLAGADGPWLARGRQRLMPADQLRIVGRHNWANALAALALVEAVGIAPTLALPVLQRFGGLSHRCQYVAEIKGVTWYNDSKGTNVGATEAACAGMPGPFVLIAGGLAKGQDFTPLGAALRPQARGVVLMGADRALLRQALTGIVPVVEASSLGEAVALAAQLAQPGDRVLLSPACASFDMFRDYLDRGECFVAEVKRLAGVSP